MSTQAIQIDPATVPSLLEKLDKIFKKDGLIVPVSAALVESLDLTELRLYCHFNGIYQIITDELIEWFKNNVVLTNAIEIGSGNGTLGRALGIRLTDNWQQSKGQIALMYQLSSQPTIQYPADVEDIDGISAIKKYKPTTVIGSWITNIYKAEEHQLGGNQEGVDELELIKLVDKYYMVGNLNIHCNNRLFRANHVTRCMHHEPYLYSRNQEKKKNFIFEFHV